MSNEKKVSVQLTDDEQALLAKPVHGQGGFQSLLKRIQACVNGDKLEVDSEMVERLGRYADRYGSGGFQGRIRSLAERVVAAARDAG